MTGRELLHRLGATAQRAKGRRTRVRVAPQHRRWAQEHASLVREAMRHPAKPIDLTHDRSASDLRLLGFERIGLSIEDAYRWNCYDTRWSHPSGDDEGNRLLLMKFEDAVVEASGRQRRRDRQATRAFRKVRA